MRIRTIKPETPQSGSLSKLTREQRLLFLYLFTVVDDAGRARAHPRVLAGQLFPYDEDGLTFVQHSLPTLAKHDLIELYQVDGTPYLHITKWSKHQYIQHKGKSRIPPPPERDRG